jgi:hypothetical protein
MIVWLAIHHLIIFQSVTSSRKGPRNAAAHRIVGGLPLRGSIGKTEDGYRDQRALRISAAHIRKESADGGLKHPAVDESLLDWYAGVQAARAGRNGGELPIGSSGLCVRWP